MCMESENIRRLTVFRKDKRLGLSIAVRAGFASSAGDGKPRRVGRDGQSQRLSQESGCVRFCSCAYHD